MGEELNRMLWQMLLVVLTLVTAYYTSKEGRRSQTASKRKETRVILVIAMLLGFASCYLAYNDYCKSLDENTRTQLQDIERRNQYAMVIKNQRSTIDTANKIIRLQNQVLEKNNIIYRLQERTINNVTGGNSIPKLHVWISPLQFEKEKRIKYFIVNFDLLLIGKYPLQNVNCTIHDLAGTSVFDIGQKHWRDGVSAGVGRITLKDWDNYSPIKKVNIGAMTPKKRYVLYTTVFSPRTKNDNLVVYPIELQWNGGSLMYYVNLLVKNDIMSAGKHEILLNEIKVKEYSKYIDIKDASN